MFGCFRDKGVKVAATFIMVDRKEKGQGEKGAMQEIEEQFGFPVYSIAVQNRTLKAHLRGVGRIAADAGES